MISDMELQVDLAREQEGVKTVLAHSQAHVDAGTLGPDPARPNTFIGSVVNDKRLNDGLATIIPTFWNGKKVSDPEAMELAISSGKTWPSAKEVPDALRLEKYIHDNFMVKQVEERQQ